MILYLAFYYGLEFTLEMEHRESYVEFKMIDISEENGAWQQLFLMSICLLQNQSSGFNLDGEAIDNLKLIYFGSVI